MTICLSMSGPPQMSEICLSRSQGRLLMFHLGGTCVVAGIVLDENTVLFVVQCRINLCLNLSLTSNCCVLELCSLISKSPASRSTHSRRPVSSLLHTSVVLGLIPFCFFKSTRRIWWSIGSGAYPQPSSHGSRNLESSGGVVYGVR